MPEDRWSESPLRSLLSRSPLTEGRASFSQQLAHLRGTIPASLGSARQHRQHPLQSPVSSTGWLRGCSNARKHMAVINSLELFAFRALRRDLGATSCPTVHWLKAEMSCVPILSCRGICTRPGSGGSEQSRETA